MEPIPEDAQLLEPPPRPRRALGLVLALPLLVGAFVAAGAGRSRGSPPAQLDAYALDPAVESTIDEMSAARAEIPRRASRVRSFQKRLPSRFRSFQHQRKCLPFCLSASRVRGAGARFS